MKNLHPYVPGEQPKERPYIKLNANENPYPPSPLVTKAVARLAKKQAQKMALYPDPDSLELKKAIADMLNKTGGVLARANLKGGKKNGSASKVFASDSDKIPFIVTPQMIYAGNGSDEVLSFIFYAFFDGDRELVLPEHTYSFYPVYAGFYGIEIDKVPLKDDWTLDKEKMILDANKRDSSIIFANPNAPTSLGMTREEIKEMIKSTPKNRVFVVDEAYVDFGGESCIPLLAEFENLLIVRTFSKSLCAAGMRLGYAVANPTLIEQLTTVKNSVNHFPIDFIAQQAGIAACNDAGYYAECARSVAFERDEFIDFLRNIGWQVLDSQTNFVFCKKDGRSGEETYKKIKDEGILVRHFNTPGIEDYLRITIGTKVQMDKLKTVMKNL
ncbi:histidinol-phosphate transaminase [Treponema pectinovorum]|uniref:histidinol-phosphate transaminase n=1 Tax=Treponema pectinovorum TaxID=164 RepID=UPI0011C8F68A|nr:histidinol-phosphate transaminase [Treponema pectinovorum]